MYLDLEMNENGLDNMLVAVLSVGMKILVGFVCVILLAILILITLVVLVLRKLRKPQTVQSNLGRSVRGRETRGILNQIIILLKLQPRTNESHGVLNASYVTDPEPLHMAINEDPVGMPVTVANKPKPPERRPPPTVPVEETNIPTGTPPPPKRDRQEALSSASKDTGSLLRIRPKKKKKQTTGRPSSIPDVPAPVPPIATDKSHVQLRPEEYKYISVVDR